MKSIFVLLSLVSLACGQSFFDCYCGLFVTERDAELEVHRLPSMHVHSCNDHKACEMLCEGEWNTMYKNGGLSYVDPIFGTTIGDQCCKILDDIYHSPEFKSHELFSYYKVCEGPWTYYGKYSNDYLCCFGGKYPGNCARPS